MEKLKLFALALLALALPPQQGATAQVRREINLSQWLFGRGAAPQQWERVAVPHDWAISGPFDKKWDLQRVAIEQNGETEATEKSGRSGALPWIGEGVYRTTVDVPRGYARAELLIDGAMAEPEVYVGGHRAGGWAYGYSAFRVDVTEYAREALPAGGKVELEVRLRNREESSRWYPGAGLYRPVTLVLTEATHIDPWGTYFRTLEADDSVARVAIDTKVEAPSGSPRGERKTGERLAVVVELIDAQGGVAASHRAAVPPGGLLHTVATVERPRLWSPESPYLYTLRTRLFCGERLLDEKSLKTGIRTISVGREGGFQLNGKTRKIKGVCLHHDLGPLGAAVNRGALVRQAEMMKEMGADAIRTSHNMPSQMQMEVCDSLGLMVMAESFDMWIYPKCKNGYAQFFEEWSDRDITNLVLANRNHPSIVMWSIGNEIPEQWSEQGRDIARHLQDLCHRLDPSRPVTQGMDRAEDALKSGFAQVMDVPGFNYRVHKYATNIKQLPQGFLLGSETASTVSSRGVYKFPVEVTDYSRFASYSPNYDPKAVGEADGQCSSYDVEHCPWSNLPDDDWRWQDDYEWVIGEFVWTGFDYLGEPTPYDEYWPARSSYFGICDLAGLPKDRYYLYRSHWNQRDHTLHLLPHWTWPGREGQVTPVYCYTDYPEAELFVNGKSQGRRRKTLLGGEENRLDRYRLRWNDVRYEPGEVRVVAYDAEGRPAAQQVVRTAGEPARLKLEPKVYDDLVFVTVSMVDKDGTLCPDAADGLEFAVEGAGRFKAVCNGDPTSLESFVEPRMRLFHGQLVVIVERQGAGDLRLTVNCGKQLVATAKL